MKQHLNILTTWGRKGLLIIYILMISLNTLAQSTGNYPVTLNLNKASIKTLFDKIQQQTGLSFIYSSDVIKDMPAITVSANQETTESVLSRVFKNTGFEYRIKNKIITIKEKYKTNAPTPSTHKRQILGKVCDADGEPLPGAAIKIKGSNMGVATDFDGNYRLEFPNNDESIIVVSYIGMKTREIDTKNKSRIDITLQEDVAIMKGLEVVGNGMFTRRTETFTGSAVTYNGDQLRVAGSQNVIASLKNLDPSFIVNESVDFGSNPNVMPDIQIRGQNNIDLKGDYATNPNQPLFILNGFETTIEKVVDMDMNLVKTITLLKDAAAKAIYGSKAANGVVVIETVQPEAGRLRVSYNASLDVTVPDLTSYDLCNASEKLQAEILAGKYTSNNAFTQSQLNAELYELQKEVARGVDTYWMAQPLRTGVGQKHSLMLDGGEGKMLYAANVSYNDVAGVMKGSDRRTISGNVTLSYRMDNLIFRNQLTVDGNVANNSPYGDFSEYSRMNPYWRIYDENGKLIKQYENGTYNPLYNSTLNSKNQSKYTLITENFYAEWNVLPTLKLTGRFGFTNQNSSTDIFTPASNTKYASILPSSPEYLERGQYDQSHASARTIHADFGVNYSLIKDKHLMFANATYSVETSKSEMQSFSAIGFPSDKMDYISFGNGYPNGGKPNGSENTTRSIGVIGSINYSYADRYLTDVSYRLNASSQFGAKNKWGHFWSVGIGWNLHHESWLKESDWLTYCKLRASIGYTGSQNFNSYQALSTYNYITDRTYNGDMGVILMALANDNLKWQRQLDRSVGVDFTLFNRFSGRVDFYSDRTDNLLTDVTLAPSSGFSSYKENLGITDNTGIEASLNYRVLSHAASRTSLNIFAGISHNKNKIAKISNALKAYNEEQDALKEDYAGTEDSKAAQRKVSTRYEEGQSMTAIWAVRSAGIDPVTGKEVFIKKDGTTTYEWSADDQVVCGDATPKIQGNIGLSARWKNIDLNVAFTYKLGGQTYNSTLVDKVENVDVNNWNVDNRVLTERWNTPGIPANFKAIGDYSTTKPTSRFVEDYNELAFSAISISYDFSNMKLIKRSPIDYLKLTGTMNDIGWLSNVKKEFGLSYPRARVFSFTLSARF